MIQTGSRTTLSSQQRRCWQHQCVLIKLYLFYISHLCQAILELIQECNLDFCIPLVVFGDDADSHRRRSFYICTLSSPLCNSGDSWDSKLLLCALDNSRAIPETYDAIDAWIIHSLTECQEGRFFSVNPWGETYDRGMVGRICGPYCGIVVGLKGDEKFIQRTLKTNASWISDGVCLYCKASQKGNMQYTFFGEKAPHRGTLVSNDAFFRHGCRMNAWLRLPGFHVDRIFLDWLHLVDLALTPEASASVAQL